MNLGLLGQFGDNVGTTLGRLWDHIGTVLGQVGNSFGTVLFLHILIFCEDYAALDLQGVHVLHMFLALRNIAGLRSV